MADVSLLSLGCKVNQCETQALEEELLRAGFTVVPFGQRADAVLINTCCVTAEGERKSRQMVRRALRQNPGALLCVTGCAAQRAPEVFASMNGVKLVVGNEKKSSAAQMIAESLSGTFVTDVTHMDCYHEQPDACIEQTRAFVKIQDGCNSFCSYCIIPYVRGRECSRAYDDILSQGRTLASHGFSELVLTGIHLSSYGKEWDYKPDLADVVCGVAGLDGITRVRLGSLEPRVVTESFLDRVTALPGFCRHFHLSLQSGSDTVLSRMNRRYTAEDFLSVVRRIRARDPRAAISTDLITGFPGETEQEFAETLALTENVGFAFVHVFPYSEREGTLAAKMPDPVEKHVREERAARLSALCAAEGKKYRRQFVGETVEVLCETNENNVTQGLTREHINVSFPGNVPSGETVSIKITAVVEHGLKGEKNG